MSSPDTRLTSVLEHAWAALCASHAAAQDQAVTLLGTQSASAPRMFDREAAREARDALDRGRGPMNAAFRRLLRERAGESGQTAATPPRDEPLDWDALTLVDDAQIESDLVVSRLAQRVAGAAEWEFRDLAALLGALAGGESGDPDRLPLRPAVLAEAFQAALAETVPAGPVQDGVQRTLSGTFLLLLPAALRAINADIKGRGVRPRGLTIPGDAGPSTRGGHSTQRDALRSTSGRLDEAEAAPSTAAATLQGALGVGRPAGFARDTTTRRAGLEPGFEPQGMPSRPGALGRTGAGSGAPAGPAADGSDGSAPVHGGRSAASDATLRALLRRLSSLSDVEVARYGDGGSGESGDPGAGPATRPGPGGGPGLRYPGAAGGPSASGPGSVFATTDLGFVAPNLIRLHQAELQRAATGALDHLVIEVVGALFDQILSDKRVPPQMARQIARLQLPVLRVTLIDPSFFASRRHPVRLFINRVASLACAFDHFEDGPGQTLLERVTALVQEIIEGDFEQVELYARKLQELERFTAEAAERAVEQQAAAPSLVARKESQLRVHQRYRAQLHAALVPLKLPPFLHEFLTQVWSQALIDAARPGQDPNTLVRYRAVARNLVMSIQPKGATAQRQRFLLLLPGLMRDLAEGVRRLGWPEAAHQRFLASLQPAHSQALRGAPLSELDHNLMVKQLDSVFGAPLPDAEGAAAPVHVSQAGALAPIGGGAAASAAAHEDTVPVAFSDTEAQQIGFVPDQALPAAGPLPSLRALQGGYASEDEAATGAAGSPRTQGAAGPGRDAADAADAGPCTEPATVPATLPLDLPAPAVDPVLPLARAGGLDVQAEPAAREPAEPAHGPGLADHLRIGFAYEMLLQERWQKVRLSHISPARNFFVFTHGHRHQQTLTMTSRMVRRICEGGRMRAVERSYLIERASERARAQLAALGRGSAAPAAARGNAALA